MPSHFPTGFKKILFRNVCLRGLGTAGQDQISLKGFVGRVRVWGFGVLSLVSCEAVHGLVPTELESS